MRALVAIVIMIVGSVGACTTPVPNEPSAEPVSATKVPEVGLDSADPAPEAESAGRPMALPWESFSWLVANSPLVFVGTVQSATAERDAARDLIVTRYRMSVDEVLVGEARDSFELVMLGGSLADLTMSVSHLPELSEGGRFIIFTDPARTTYDPITGNEHGVFRIGPDDGVYGYSGLPVIGMEDDRLLVDVPPLPKVTDGPAVAAGQPEGQAQVEGDVQGLQPAVTSQKHAMTLEAFAELVRSSKATR
jgi:hypothetical protein